MMYNLLSDPVFRVIVDGKQERLSLPALLAVLMQDRVDGFPGQRPHQRHVVHMFLVCMESLALYHANETDIPVDAERWTELLLNLTGGAQEPWCLVVEDLSKPAFMQPPVPEGSLSVLKNTITTPDVLDVLIIAKNVELKWETATDAELDEWIYALICLQTMEGYLGATLYGISRMNGGFSARPFLGLAPRGGMGAHVKRDILAMLALRQRQPDIYEIYDDKGIALLWLEPWDGKTGFSLSSLDPWYIEICRRIRFAPQGEGFIARGVGTAVARIDAKASNGITGDFWAPVNAAEGKAFSLDGRGYSYRVLCQLIFGDGAKQNFNLPPAMMAQPGEGDMMLVARGIARGQGKTEGFHERIVPVRRSMARGIATPESRKSLGEIANLQQREIAQIASSLRFACAVAAIGGGQDKPGKDDYGHAKPFTERLEAEADADFFNTLQDRHEQGETAKIPYLRHLIAYADRLLADAAASIPCPSQHRWRARVRASAAFYGTLWKGALVNDRALIFPPKETADART